MLFNGCEEGGIVSALQVSCAFVSESRTDSWRLPITLRSGMTVSQQDHLWHGNLNSTTTETREEERETVEKQKHLRPTDFTISKMNAPAVVEGDALFSISA